jgi:hypothetical protein
MERSDRRVIRLETLIEVWLEDTPNRPGASRMEWQQPPPQVRQIASDAII